MCVRPDGSIRPVADGLRWPNGKALAARLSLPTWGTSQLVAFDVADDAIQHGHADRCFACLPGGEDGACAVTSAT